MLAYLMIHPKHGDSLRLTGLPFLLFHYDLSRVLPGQHIPGMGGKKTMLSTIPIEHQAPIIQFDAA